MFLVNSGPGAALVEDFKLIYKGSSLPNPILAINRKDQRPAVLFAGQHEWAFGIASLAYLRDAALLCEGRKVEGCLRVGFHLNWPNANYLISPGERVSLLRIDNLDEIRKRVSEDEFLEWGNQFGDWSADSDFQLDYCPVSREFGPCRKLTNRSISALPELPACKTGLAALLP